MLYLSLFEAHSSPPKPYGYRWGVLLHNYECNSRSRSALSAQQLNYLNNLYTKYNSVRHPYSHWSASDVDTAVITSIDEARNLLNDGIILVNQYYTLF